MLFKRKDLKGIKSGEVSLAFRNWKTARVKKGSLIKSPVGLIEILEIEKIKRSGITPVACKQAGFKNLQQLEAALQTESQEVFRIALRFHSEDPRIALRQQSSLSPEELELLKSRLQKMDGGKFGKWTTEVLLAIAQNPGTRAADLCILLDKEKEWLKRHIRKLKSLGLTISEEIGYRVSPLGEYYLQQINF